MPNLDDETAIKWATASDRWVGDCLVVTLGTAAGALAHLIFCWKASFALFAAAGGVSTSGLWTRYGSIDCAWTNLAWLPGGIVLAATGDRSPPTLGALALLLLLLGSLLAGYFTARVAIETIRGSRNYGRYRWRIWVCALLWLGWVPVPVKVTLTYWHTVAY